MVGVAIHGGTAVRAPPPAPATARGREGEAGGAGDWGEEERELADGMASLSAGAAARLAVFRTVGLRARWLLPAGHGAREKVPAREG
jgi:hypothetical protein